MQQHEASSGPDHEHNSSFDIPKLRAIAREHNDILACLKQLSDTHQSLQVARFHLSVFSDLMACRRREFVELRLELQEDTNKRDITSSTLLAGL